MKKMKKKRELNSDAKIWKQNNEINQKKAGTYKVSKMMIKADFNYTEHIKIVDSSKPW